MATGKPDWKTLREQARPRTKRVRLCLDGELLAQLAEAEAADITSLSGNPEAAKLREQVDAASVTFTLKGLPRGEYRRLEKAHPSADDDGAWNTDTFPEALVRACLVEPGVSADEPLFDVLTSGEADKLFEVAFLACNEADAVPLQKRG